MKRQHPLPDRRMVLLGIVVATVIPLVAVLFVTAQTYAQAADGGTADPDGVALSPPRPGRPTGLTPPDGSLARTAVVLGGTVAVIAAIGVVARRLVPGLAPARSGLAIEVLAQRALGARGTVYVVRCGPRVLIIGATPGQLTTLAEIADPEEIEEFTQSRQSGAATAGAAAPVAGSAPAANRHVDGLLEKIHDWRAAN